MNLFFQNSLAFPSIIFSALLVIISFYWLCAALGLLDIDLFNIDSELDVDATGFAGWLTKLGLAGIPVTIILTFFTVIGWFISYFTHYWIISVIETGFIYYFVGFVALIIISFISLNLTAVCLKPIRKKLISRNKPKSVHQLIGKLAIVRSANVAENKGEAVLEDGGAGLILQIRAPEQENIKRGDSVVIISYDALTHSYQVVTEDEFHR